jgi:hypothetical protein
MSNLSEILKAESIDFPKKYGFQTPLHPVEEMIVIHFNASRGELPPSLSGGPDWSADKVGAAFAIMHGYLNQAYIDGWAEKDDPPWAGCRQSSWNRWIDHLVHVGGIANHSEAQEFASVFFQAVDKAAPYT